LHIKDEELPGAGGLEGDFESAKKLAEGIAQDWQEVFRQRISRINRVLVIFPRFGGHGVKQPF
jgi:hypothetical protein